MRQIIVVESAQIDRQTKTIKISSLNFERYRIFRAHGKIDFLRTQNMEMNVIGMKKKPLAEEKKNKSHAKRN